MNTIEFNENKKNVKKKKIINSTSDDCKLLESDEKNFLNLPRLNMRRTSLPANEEKQSPHMSPRRFLDYIKVSY